MTEKNLKINAQSIRTELKSYEDKPYDCLFEYIWNAYDAGATEVRLNFTEPFEGIGSVTDVSLKDNGSGWDFNDEATINNFMSSTKVQIKNKTLPMGRYGRGRYAFIWIAEKLEAYSKSKKMTLQHDTNIYVQDVEDISIGTCLHFINITDKFSDALTSEQLENSLAIEFGWFLLQNDDRKIYVNDCQLSINSIVREIYEYHRDDISEPLREDIPDDFYAKIIIWNKKPTEYSKFYFINANNEEEVKFNTGLNKKSDDFWHSVYLKSSLFINRDDLTDAVSDDSQCSFDFIGNERLLKQIGIFFKTELTKIRKPYLQQQSTKMYQALIDENVIPNLNEFGIYDTNSFGDLLKTIYTITPSLFTNRNNQEKKFICATFAGLLSTQDNNLVKLVLEQLQDLTDEEKSDLLDILKRTKLSNIVATIKEIDYRLDVINKLELLLADYEKQTLEVKHLQKILDDNFWIFGEQFRLFSSTEGALKNTLMRYASEILMIESPKLGSNPTGEVDLFLTKTEYTSEICQRNIIVELKRASKELGKKEYDQLESYMEKIKNENLCNGTNQYWEFYLIGKDYNTHIADKIESAKNHGESARGLCYSINDGHYKIYVRKWSDILEVEWKNKMRYLKDKLQIKSQTMPLTPIEIVDSIVECK